MIEKLKGAKAIRVTESLISPSPFIKLPSYAKDKNAKVDEPRFVTWGDKDINALVDSVQSQANRIETIFNDYSDLVPATQVIYPNTTIPLTEVPHRAADPAVSRYFRTELDSISTDPAALARRAPTAYLFGICDIRNQRNIKLTRAIAADITVRGGQMRPAASSLSTPFSNEVRADLTEMLGGMKGSEAGVEQVLNWTEKGTVDVTNAVITRTVTFSLEVFDKYKANVELWNYLVGLALVATLAPTTSVLRSGTTLVRSSRKVEMFADLKPVEVVDENGLFDEVLAFARAAAAKFGIGQAETLTVSLDAIVAEAKSGSEIKKKVSDKKTKKAEAAAV